MLPKNKRRLAEIAGQYLTKGQEAYIEGRLQTRKYTAKDGTERRATEVVAENMQLGSRPQGSSTSQSSSNPASPSNQNNNTSPKAPEEQIPTIDLDEEEEEVKIEDVPF
ncbi:MAG TPA: single-stranded DNA-binding protein [Candidatus Moranbacteria bacterium]|nr:single-stranded DNA-binding protein [Candidatus Moranbacteria bacterium]